LPKRYDEPRYASEKPDFQGQRPQDLFVGAKMNSTSLNRPNGQALIRSVCLLSAFALASSACTSGDKANQPKVSSPETATEASAGSTSAEPKSLSVSNEASTATAIKIITLRNGKTVKIPVKRFVPKVPVIPAAPVPLKTRGPALSRAQELAESSKAGSKTAEAAWLSAYDLARIPVFSDEGKPIGTTGDDPLGSARWQVWMSADGGNGTRLTDAMKIAAVSSKGPISEESAKELARFFVEDLRSARDSHDNVAVFTAEFLDAKLQQAGTPFSLFDDRLELETAHVDSATNQFIGWLITRQTAFAMARTEAKARASQIGASPKEVPTVPATPVSLTSSNRDQWRRSNRKNPPKIQLLGFHLQNELDNSNFYDGPPPSGDVTVRPFNCSEIFGSSTTTAITNWLLGKISTGMNNVGGFQFEGFISYLLDKKGIGAATIGSNYRSFDVKLPDALGIVGTNCEHEG
jgi:hypothetical protein